MQLNTELTSLNIWGKDQSKLREKYDRTKQRGKENQKETVAAFKKYAPSSQSFPVECSQEKIKLLLDLRKAEKTTRQEISAELDGRKLLYNYSTFELHSRLTQMKS